MGQEDLSSANFYVSKLEKDKSYLNVLEVQLRQENYELKNKYANVEFDLRSLNDNTSEIEKEKSSFSDRKKEMTELRRKHDKILIELSSANRHAAKLEKENSDLRLITDSCSRLQEDFKQRMEKESLESNLHNSKLGMSPVESYVAILE